MISYDKDLMLDGNNLICSYHPTKAKSVVVSICYKVSLAARLVGIPLLPECVVDEVTIQN